MVENNKKLSLVVGERIKEIRKSLRYSRKKFCAKYGVNYSTLQSWEEGRRNLTEKSATLLANIYKIEGIDCSVEWLLFGVGEHPLEQGFKQNSDINIFEKIKEGFGLFYGTSKFNIIDLVIFDNSMSPILSKGDWVAGKIIGNLEKAINQLSIVKFDNGKMDVGIFNKNESGKFILHKEVGGNCSACEADILIAVPVLWIRKNSSS